MTRDETRDRILATLMEIAALKRNAHEYAEALADLIDAADGLDENLGEAASMLDPDNHDDAKTIEWAGSASDAYQSARSTLLG
jgi:hypothetical protein